jgi:pimeloyl-ACP methyl ester carboxylesterase
MRQFIARISIVSLILLLGSLGWLAYSAQKNLATASNLALRKIETNTTLNIENGDWLIMKPKNQAITAGLILYPGANCDLAGYAPVLTPLAEQGYLVVVPRMPFNLAIFSPNAADKIRAAYPEIGNWVLAGHSIGGAAASQYAVAHDDQLAGLVLWDAHPSKFHSLAGLSSPVAHIHRATLDGKPPPKMLEKKFLFPRDSEWIAIVGGTHMNFGSFSDYNRGDEWPADITQQAQHQLISETMLRLMSEMLGEAIQ